MSRKSQPVRTRFYPLVNRGQLYLDREEGSDVSEFEFSLDRERRLLTVAIHGFWDVQIYRAYDARLRVELAGLKRLPRRALAWWTLATSRSSPWKLQI